MHCGLCIIVHKDKRRAELGRWWLELCARAAPTDVVHLQVTGPNRSHRSLVTFNITRYKVIPTLLRWYCKYVHWFHGRLPSHLREALLASSRSLLSLGDPPPLFSSPPPFCSLSFPRPILSLFSSPTSPLSPPPLPSSRLAESRSSIESHVRSPIVGQRATSAM